LPEAILIDQTGGKTGRYAVVGSKPFVLGRAPFADLGHESRTISRRHAEIVSVVDGYVIRDLDSANGTAVNGKPVGSDPVKLLSGDVISLANGAAELRIELGGQTVKLDQSNDSGDLEIDSELVVDSKTRQVYVYGDALTPTLSRKEFDLLEALFSSAGDALSVQEIAATVWPERVDGSVDATEVSQLVTRVRRRTGMPVDGAQIVSVRGFGYRLDGYASVSGSVPQDY
jgi:pSer/pThr/pTyr-binding forkhead associated (FHA) protein